MKLSVIVFICVVSKHTTDSANILGIFQTPTKSHYRLGYKLFKELVARGHQVTVISPYPQEKPLSNFTDVSVPEVLNMIQNDDQTMFTVGKQNVLSIIHFIHTVGIDIMDKVLSSPSVQGLIKSNQTFDLILAEIFMNEAALGFAHRFDCPVIFLAPFGSSVFSNDLIANPAPYSYVPNRGLPFTDHMTFTERMINSIPMVVFNLYRYWYYLPRQDQLIRNYFPDAPDFWTLTKKIGIILENSHTSIFYPVPSMPNAIDIAGFHIDEPKPLPKDLQDYLDAAKEGVIYFSMGSHLRSVDLPEEKRNAILQVFSKLPYKVLWKWEEEKLPNQPKNVKLGKWFPQQDVLAHPNVKLFITHGGLLSTIEAVHHGVPVIGIPIYGDQTMNIGKAVSNGYGLAIPFDELEEKTLARAINEILRNPKYKDNIKKKSSLFRDRPLKPLDEAMFWIENILKHKSGEHFHSGALDLQWYQYFLLDVIAFLVALVVLVFVVMYLLIVKCLFKKRRSENKKKKE